MKHDLKIIVCKESMLASIISDMVTFGIPAIFAWLNYKYLGNSSIYQWCIVIVFLICSVSKSSSKVRKFYNKEDAINYINESETK